MSSTYDRIGTAYGETRKEDPRIARLIFTELGGAATVLNVGAGAGSYEPSDRRVVAVEPSRVMIEQRPRDSAPVVQAVAESLPFADNSFDAAMAVLTLHHWNEAGAGLAELDRVARARILLLTWDPSSDGFWLVRDYFPAFLARDRKRLPPIDRLTRLLDDPRVIPVPIPHDCRDGFLGAYWRRPEAYLDPKIRGGISSFASWPDPAGLRALERDIESGEWARRNGDLLETPDLDIGYRLIVGRPGGLR
jgi:SAM-dependent methyltransferase